MTTNDDVVPIPIDDLRRAFHVDGSFRDIFVADTNLTDWEHAYEYLRHLASSGIAHIASEPDPLPAVMQDIFGLRRDKGARLEVHLSKVQINCFLFSEDEIEFDVDPRELKSDADMQSVASFMRGLGSALARPVHLTEENVHQWRWLTFDPISESWTFEPEQAR